MSSAEPVDRIVERIAGSVPAALRIPAHKRAEVLRECSKGIRSEEDALASLICEEVGKPIKAARQEVSRAAFVFDWAAAEAQRFGGEWLPLDVDPAGEGRLAVVRRYPRGACLFITPFNFPLNLAVHKVAPAIAAGAPFVLKPPPQAPRIAMKLGEIVRSAGWPEEFFSVLHCSDEIAEGLVRDPRFAVLSFTGSAKVGWHLRSIAGRKHVTLELGGNAGAVVAEDADLPFAAARCAMGAFAYSGQVCVSVQRIFVAEAVYDRFRDLLLEEVGRLAVGDPADEGTDVGPLIDDRAAERIESWLKEAVDAGGKLLTGGRRNGRTFSPAVVEGAPASCRLSTEEVFGPVTTLDKVRDAEEGLRRLGEGAYGLHAGLFTRDLRAMLSAWSTLQVGGLIINDVPTYRSDAMPYGGTKLSGTGREGVRYAMEEYTETRTLVLKG